MDIIWPLLLMAILYLVPEILKKRRKSTQYEYPEIPKEMNIPTMQQDIQPPLMKVNKSEAKFSDKIKPANNEVNSLTESSLPQEGLDPWQGKLNEAFIINGLICSEILQPPRAFRPIKYLKKLP